MLSPRAVGLVIAGLVTLFRLPMTHAEPVDIFEMKYEEISEGVWVGSRTNALQSPVEGNVGIVLGTEGVLIFDAGGVPLTAQRTLAKVNELTDLPVTHIVNSHWHGDHHLGNNTWKEAYPNAQIIAHSFTKAAIHSPLMNYIKNSDQGIVNYVKALQVQIEKREHFDGSPMTEAWVKAYEVFVENGPLIVEQYTQFQIVVPDLTFEETIDIDLGDRSVQLLHIGRGNTAGDAMMYLPETKILFTGDAVVRPTPYGFNSYPAEWVEVLNGLREMDVHLFVPGHGKPFTDHEYLQLLTEVLTAVIARVAPLVDSGKTLEEVKQEVPLDDFVERFALGDPLIPRLFVAWFASPIVEAAYKNAKGIPTEPLDTPATEDH